MRQFQKIWVAFAHKEAVLQVLEEAKTTEAIQRVINLAKEFQTVWDHFKDTRNLEIIVALKEHRIDDAKRIAYGIQEERFELMKKILEEIGM